MKWHLRLLYLALGLTLLGLLGRSVLSSLSSGPVHSDQPEGVRLAPPTGYHLTELAEPTFAEAVAALEAARAGGGPVGLHFRRQGTEVYWLADPGADLLEERTAGAGGTRLQTIWRGGLQQRLAWGREHGNFEAAGLPAGVRANLYH